MKIVVDRTRCEGNAVCEQLAPEVFHVDDDDNLVVLMESPPDSLRVSVDAARNACPKNALRLDSGSGE